ncbi:hypothetical protein BGZ82_007711 [Podila clonocystis]|nr:hypothetical protein BGZ82_007711 [Podila clonocystis]
MKILSIAACLAFVAVVVAQSQQVLDVKEHRPPTAEEREALDRELPRVISEFHFRQALLSEPIHMSDNKFEIFAKDKEGDSSGKCFQAMSFLSGIFDKMIDAADGLEVPIITQFFKVMLGVPKTGFKLSEASVATALQSAFHGVTLGSHAMEEAFKIMFAYTDLLPAALIGGPFSAIEQALDAAVTCFATASKIEQQFNVATCSVYADVYRGVVDEVASKPIEVPSDASEELKRALSGAHSVVDLSKSSVATANEDLLTTRPIFMANVLDQYREEVNRLATSDDIKNYAQLKLSSVVASSNALEACLRIAADPEAAAEELDEEIDDMEDEDYFEDADEDADENEDEDS